MVETWLQTLLNLELGCFLFSPSSLLYPKNSEYTSIRIDVATAPKSHMLIIILTFAVQTNGNFGQ